MLGNNFGFAALVKKKTPNVTVTHCMLHRHALVAKKFAVNSQRTSIILCENG